MYVLIKSKATGDVTDYHNEIHDMKGSFFYKQVEIQNENFRPTASTKENKTRYGDVFKKIQSTLKRSQEKSFKINMQNVSS